MILKIVTPYRYGDPLDDGSQLVESEVTSYLDKIDDVRVIPIYSDDELTFEDGGGGVHFFGFTDAAPRSHWRAQVRRDDRPGWAVVGDATNIWLMSDSGTTVDRLV